MHNHSIDKKQSFSKEQLFSELKELYRLFEQDISLINPCCNKCGMCCDFGKYDHVLFASSIEVDYITHNVKAPDFDITKNVCPFLKNGMCDIRDYRMLSCRTFYCDEKHKEETRFLHEKYHRLIKALYNKYHIDWHYSPFLSQLKWFESNKLKSCKIKSSPDI